MSQTHFFSAIFTETSTLGCCQRSRLFCARPSCDQVALWAIKKKKWEKKSSREAPGKTCGSKEAGMVQTQNRCKTVISLLLNWEQLPTSMMS